MLTRTQAWFWFILISIGLFGAASLLVEEGRNNDWIGRIEERFSWTEHQGKEREASMVKRVVDGDTIELENGERVRYIGINTPEVNQKNSPDECFGSEAMEFNRNLVEGKVVRLERDVSERDKYGRLLRYVYLEDGTLVNEKLVREGYASVSSFPPDISHQKLLRAAEKEARGNKRGLWADETCRGKR